MEKKSSYLFHKLVDWSTIVMLIINKKKCCVFLKQNVVNNDKNICIPARHNHQTMQRL